jgi:hypothetical protein
MVDGITLGLMREKKFEKKVDKHGSLTCAVVDGT